MLELAKFGGDDSMATTTALLAAAKSVSTCRLKIRQKNPEG